MYMRKKMWRVKLLNAVTSKFRIRDIIAYSGNVLWVFAKNWSYMMPLDDNDHVDSDFIKKSLLFF